nr:uncharacterized protein LOC129385443 [Dermacentor andersoni]
MDKTHALQLGEPSCPEELEVPSAETPQHVAAGSESSLQDCSLPSFSATPDGCRTVSGRLGPTRPGEGKPCKQLSCDKLDALLACLSHWGKETMVTPQWHREKSCAC